ncbi:homeodomain-like protein [Tanacetum coccineum]
MTELTLEESLSMFMTKFAKRLDENTNFIKELQASTNFALRNQEASIKALKIQVRQMSIELHEKLSGDLRSSTVIKPRVDDETIFTSVETEKPLIRRIDASQYAETDGGKDLEAHYTNAKPLGKDLPRKEKDPKRLGDLIPTKLIVELADRTVKRPEGIVENVLVCIDKFTFPIDFIILDIPEDFKTPSILGRPFLSTAHAIINVVYALSLIKSTELDLEARLMGDALRKNRSHDPKFENYVELSDLNEPLELRHDQVVDLGPIIEEGEVIDTPIKEMVKTRHDDDKITNGIKDYPSFSDPDKKIHVNDAYNLRFFCMIGYEHIDVNFFPLLSINTMSKRFYDSIMNDKLEFKGKSVVGAFINAPTFVGTFFVVIDFAMIKDMDHYRDEEMGDVIVRKEFGKEIRVKAKRFEGMITIFNGDDEVAYQMARSHPRFKHLTNIQCNKIKPLLKESAQDVMDGISHPYQKLKGFYKGVLNLGPDFIRVPSMEEWLTRGHISMHEMECDIIDIVGFVGLLMMAVEVVVDLAAKKSTMLVKYPQSGNLEVLES